jgi:hypothetical protein
MSTSPTLPPAQPDQLVTPRQRRRWPRQLGIIAAVLVALGIGIGIGTAAGSNQSKINAQAATISADKATISGLRSQVSQLQGTALSLHDQMSTDSQQLAAETNTANHALAAATAKVKAADAARQAQLNSEAATLKSQQAQLAQQQGITQNNQISSDGVYVIGRDMKGGIWHTSGGSQCYYATLGSTDTSNILNNNNFNGPDTVDVSGAYAFEISGGCTWVKIA